jgi:hypothetical protein
MGGLLHATNVIPTHTDLCSALTAVDLETLHEFAQIDARPGRPFVLGLQNNASIQQVVEEVVALVGHYEPPHASTQTTGIPRHNGNSEFHDTTTLDSFPDRPICASLQPQGDHQLNKLSTALGVVDALLLSSAPPSSQSNAGPDLIEMIELLNLPSRLTPETIERGIQDVQ